MKLILSLLSVGLLSSLAFAEQGVFELHFEEAAARDAARSRMVTLENVLLEEADGRFYADLDGDGAVIVTAEDDELSFGAADTFWCELWINPAGSSGSTVLLSKGTGANYRLTLEGDGTLGFSYYSKGSWRSYRSTEHIPYHEWQHVGVLLDPNAAKLMMTLNGTVIGVSEMEAPFQSRDKLPLYIGGQRQQDGSYAGLKGLIGNGKIARENLRQISSEAQSGEKAFEVNRNE